MDEIVCNNCNENIDLHEKHASFEGFVWHENCFVCSICSENMENVLFALNDLNEILCYKCYDEKFGIICSTCQDVVKLGDEKFKLGHFIWHRKCFQCQNCRDILNPNSFWLHDNLSYCKNCYGELFTEICDKCQEKIWKNLIKFRDLNLHSECFMCNVCELRLTDKSFFYKNELIFCDKCYNENCCKTCARCNEYITGVGGEEMITSNNENWHNKCFFCSSCNQSLVGLSFAGSGTKIYCPGCSK